jgi:regulator of sigma E protease
MIYASSATVERNGTAVEIPIPENIVEMLTDGGAKAMFYPRVPAVFNQYGEDSPNANSGLLKNDKFVMFDSSAVRFHDEVRTFAKNHPGRTIEAIVERDGQQIELQLAVSDSGLFGIEMMFPKLSDMKKSGMYAFEVREYGFAESFPAGVAKAWDKLKGYVQQFKLIFNPKTGAYKSVGGFGAIGSMFSPTWDWRWFWEMTAILSVILAFMNILPIPALDGGHVMFLLYEMVTGRAPNQKLMEKAQIIGMLLLLTLLILANGNDVFKAIFK